MSRRVIAVWLDGFDMALADSYRLPTLTSLQSRGLVASLDNGTAHLTGLTGEHLASGLDPEAASRFSAIRFDPDTYRCVQEGIRHDPVFGGVRTVAFDMAYFDLDQADGQVVGISSWGVHDPGGQPQARPSSLREELQERFGSYPAQRWIYGIPWPSSEKCAQMGISLSQAAEVRGRIATWLIGERFTDWELALIGFSEAHSASEGLFHGSGPSHPWASLPSAPAAETALRSVYVAIDQAVGEIVDHFPDDTVIVFSMHGMGPNNSDVPSMALLGELMARWCGFELEPTRRFARDADGIPPLAPDQGWTDTVLESLAGRKTTHLDRAVRATRRRVRRAWRKFIARHQKRSSSTSPAKEKTLGWMPLMRHQPRWSQMKAFALPSFYDGRIRVNLAGREARGLVTRDEYPALLDELERVLRSCTESRTGLPVVSRIVRVDGDPFSRTVDDADMVVHWAPDVLGISHPELGVIGPLPPRRTGGHSSPIGRCIIVGADVPSGDLGVRSSFDVVPTILRLAGAEQEDDVSGQVLVESLN